MKERRMMPFSLDKRREYNKRYYQAHLEYYRSYDKARDPAKICERNKRYREANREKVQEYKKQWQRRHPEKRRQARRRAHLKKRFGMSLQQYDAMLAKQKGLCAICGTPPKSGSLRVDHDHADGSVRGLLCNACNQGIGIFKDSPTIVEAALKYLKKHSQLRLVTSNDDRQTA